MTAVIHHHVPGRTRLRLDPWPAGAALDRVHDALLRLGCMIERTSAASGSILVRHHERLSAQAIRQSAELHARTGAGEGAGTGGAGPPARNPESDRDDGLEQLTVLETAEILRSFQTGEQGLDQNEAKHRLAAHGENAAPAPSGRSAGAMAAEQVTTFPVALLFGSAILSVATGGLIDAVVTLGVVAANAAIGFSSENATEKLIRRLSRPVEHEAAVIRNGAGIAVPARQIVPGDIIALAPGSFVPADARILECSGLSVDESGLTGESLPVQKQAGALDQQPVAVADRLNILHAGTVVTGGNGRAVVIRTGSETEMARTRAMIGLARPPRPVIEEQLGVLGQRLSVGCLGASALVFVTGLLRGEPLLAMMKSAIALAVAAIPEGLPAVATSTLALGARAMEREKAYVRVLSAIEALGTIDTICLDKTGTLTENRMRVVAAHVDGRILDLSPGREWESGDRAGLQPLAEAVTLCNEASLADGTGSATEMALLHFARLAGADPDHLQLRSPILTVHARNHNRHWMATEHRHEGGRLLAVKGAPDELLAMASHELSDGAARPLDKERRDRISEANQALASRGLRMLGVARRDGDLGADDPDDLVWLGLVGLADPIRAEASEAIETFHKAGIRTIMLTGDQPATALAVAETLALSRTGIIPVVETSRFAGLDNRQVGELALKTSVFARVSPADKLRIVNGLQAVGKRVAMIGDGINDGPALRAAAVGVAMGAGGTDVAREVADIVIADDDLRALARAIARGRATNDNIRTAIRYFLSTNLSEVLVMLGESLHGRGELETPMELFWLNLVTDILPGLGLALAEPRGDVMTRPPRATDAPLFTGTDIRAMAMDGGGIAAASLLAHFLRQAHAGPGPAARTTTFLTLAFGQIAQAWILRDRSVNTRDARGKSEHRLEATLSISTALLAAPFLLPPLRKLLGIAVPTAGDLALAGGLAGLSFLLAESRQTPIPGNAAAAGPSQASRLDRTMSAPVRRRGLAQAG